MAVFGHFDPFYQHLGRLLAADAAAAAAFAECRADADRVRCAADLLAAAGVLFQPQQDDAVKDDALATKMLDAALAVRKLRLDFEKDSEDEEVSLDYLNKELFLYGGAIRTGTIGGEVAQEVLLGRATLLSQLGHFKEALLDCQRLKIDPKNVQQQCQLALVQSACLAKDSRPEAEGVIKSALGALSRSESVGRAEKATLTTQLVQQMKKLEECAVRAERCHSNFAGECPALLMGPHPSIPHVSAAVELRASEEKGRFLVAATTIDAGSVVIVDEPYAWMLSPSAWHDHCTHCCRPVLAPIPCPTCCQICFCSEECLSAAATYHRFECRLLHHFSSSAELSSMALLVVRVVVRAQPHLATPEADPDYARVHQQVTNSESRPLGDLLKRTATALFLGQGLRKAGFKCQGTQVEEALLRHLQSCSCNAYEISEQVSAVNQGANGEVLAIGGAVYPSVSLANHACWANLCRTSQGKRCVVRATRRILPGEELLDNYGYSFLGVSRQDRRHALRKQYFFECACLPCRDDWPLFPNLKPDTKFQCAKCKKLTLKPTCKNCSPKGAAKHIEKELRMASDRCQVAIAKIKAQSVDESVEQWLKEFIHEMQERVVLPNKEFLIAQQALIKTWGLQANTNRVLTFNET